MDLTDEDIRAARERGRQEHAKMLWAVSARYDKRRDQIVVGLANGAEFSFPPAFSERLKDAPPSVLSNIEILGAGTGLHWPQVDEDLYVPALLQGVFGTKIWMASLMGKSGGQARTKAKAAAARKNGKRGGRPRKKVPA